MNSTYNEATSWAKYGFTDDGLWPPCYGCLSDVDGLTEHMGPRGCLVDTDKYPDIAKNIERFDEILKFQDLENPTPEQRQLLYSLVVPEGLPIHINNVLVPVGANYMEAMKKITGHY
jgi:hypothetical protein